MNTDEKVDSPDQSRFYRRPIEKVGVLHPPGTRSQSARGRVATHTAWTQRANAPDTTARWRRFLAQFQDMLVILLLVATAIWAALWAYERDAALPYEAMATLAVILLNVTKGYIQESRAEAAVAALRAMSAADATVSRAGERAIAATDLVSSDLILIEKAIRFQRTNAWANRLRYRRPP